MRLRRRRAGGDRPGAKARRSRLIEPVLGIGRLDRRVGFMIALFPLLIAATVGYGRKRPARWRATSA
jgi:hypothetical protein